MMRKTMVEYIKKLERERARREAKKNFGWDLCNLLMTHISRPLFRKAESQKGLKKYIALHTAARVQWAAIRIYHHYSSSYLDYLRSSGEERRALRDYVILEGLAKPNYYYGYRRDSF